MQCCWVFSFLFLPLQQQHRKPISAHLEVSVAQRRIFFLYYSSQSRFFPANPRTTCSRDPRTLCLPSIRKFRAPVDPLRFYLGLTHRGNPCSPGRCRQAGRHLTRTWLESGLESHRWGCLRSRWPRPSERPRLVLQSTFWLLGRRPPQDGSVSVPFTAVGGGKCQRCDGNERRARRDISTSAELLTWYFPKCSRSTRHHGSQCLKFHFVSWFCLPCFAPETKSLAPPTCQIWSFICFNMRDFSQFLIGVYPSKAWAILLCLLLIEYLWLFLTFFNFCEVCFPACGGRARDTWGENLADQGKRRQWWIPVSW